MKHALLALTFVGALISARVQADAPRVFATAVGASEADTLAAHQLAALARAALLDAHGFSVHESLTVLRGPIEPVEQAYRAASGALVRGRQAYLALDLNEARSELEQAMVHWPEALALLDSPEPVSETLLYLGATCVLLGDRACSQRAFAQHQAAYAELEPDAQVFNPQIVAAWRSAGRELLSAPSAALEVSAQPQAEITLDGRVVGLGSFRAPELTPGAHWLRVAVPGATPFVRVLQLSPKGVTHVDVPKLEPDEPLAEALADARQAGQRAGLRRMLAADALAVLTVWHAPSGLTVELATDGTVAGAPLPARRVEPALRAEAAAMRALMAEFLEQVARRVHARAEASQDPRGDAQPGREKPWYRRPWLWTVLGVAVVGGATATALVMRSRAGQGSSADEGASLTLEF